MKIEELRPLMVHDADACDTHQNRGALAGYSMPRISTLTLNTAPAALACFGFVSGVSMRDESEASAFAIASVVVTIVSGLFAFYSAGILVTRDAEDRTLRFASGALGLSCMCAGAAQALWIARVPLFGYVPP